MRGAIALLGLVLMVGCVGAPPVTCADDHRPTCEGEAGDGYEWRVICPDEGAGGVHGNRYVACGVSVTSGETLHLDDEAAVCDPSPACLSGETPPRCVAVPCDGFVHRLDVL